MGRRLTTALAVLCATVPCAAAERALLIEAEALESIGGFQIQEGDGGLAYLSSGPKGGVVPAVGAVRLPASGVWRLWVRSRSLPEDQPGMRHFSVRVGGSRSPAAFGAHRSPTNAGWEWEDGGLFELPAGPALLVIGETNTAWAQCDALVLAQGAWRPQGAPLKLGIPTAESMTLQIRPLDPAATFRPERLAEIAREPIFRIENKLLRISFHSARTGSGAAIATAAEVRQGTGWKPLPGGAESESYRVLVRPLGNDPQIVAGGVQFPTWDLWLSPEFEFAAGDATVRTRLGPATAPWLAGRCYTLRPTRARRIDGRTAELSFRDLPAGRLTATWHLREEGPSAEVTLRFMPSGPGQISLGYHGLVAAPPSALDFLLLPFMYHGRRFPARPVSMLNALTPAPLSLVNQQGISYALVAEPSELPFEWYGVSNSRYAFGIRNESGDAQPFVYTPVLGQAGSVSDGRSPVTARFHVWMQQGDWYAAFRDIVTGPFQFGDYRRPTYASLSDTALNLLDLLRNEAANGWDARAKGPWNIENRNTVTHSSPLLYMSYYLLTGDEVFYRRYALPALEFLASRPSQHFSALGGRSRDYGAERLGGPVGFYGATVYSGAYAMTHGRTPALGEFCLTADGKAASRGGTHPDPFEDALALYRLTGEARWLKQAVEGADRYIAGNLKRLPTTDLGSRPFLNTSFVPNWEGLLHLYEATGERRFLDAAAEGARWLLTTLWVHPLVPQREVTIHPGGRYEHSNTVWWLGDLRYRLGLYKQPTSTTDFPRINLPPTPLPERRVPAWQVSNLGLGLEQPFTYPRQRNHANITMSIWAPNLLRLAELTGDSLFRTAARNATIGRFGNYPGYYIDGYTDHYQRPDYPVTGPDVTTIYHHHIPVFAAYILDYLFTDAEVRSKGQVRFPWVRQNGYVWFDSRLRGHAPGQVYGDMAWPWLHRTAATVDSVNVDVVLAHGGGKFHAILLNQTPEPQRVTLRLDAGALGRPVQTATLLCRLDNQPAAPIPVRGGSATLQLGPFGIASLTLDGVRIDVPTHRSTPPDHLPLPSKPAVERQKIAGSELEAAGMIIAAPPFTWRNLFVYVAGGMGECSGATLVYRVGEGAEQRVSVDGFPCEFSVQIADMKSAVEWRVESVRR